MTRILALLALLALLLQAASAAVIVVAPAGQGAGLLTTLPDWNDEQAAYALRELDDAGAELDLTSANSGSQISTFTAHSSEDDTHNDTEGDFLWTAHHQYKRQVGIRNTSAGHWLTRRNNLVTFFRDNYVDGSAWNSDQNFDHLYGWGLCDYAKETGDSAAITTINTIVSRMVAWNANDFVRDPGDTIGGGNDTRRWPRQLRFAVCAAELSPISTNINWRDKVIDIVLQASNWDATRKAYWWEETQTDNLGFDYASGDRITNTFHMGIMSDALWQTWRVLDAESDERADTVAQRLIDIATFYRDSAELDGSGFLRLANGFNISGGDTPIAGAGTGTPAGVYSLPPINGLVMAYKLTGESSYLDRAWTLYRNWQASPGLTPSVSDGEIQHYVDSRIASGTGNEYLTNNKGELQYVYALFENGGQPIVIGGFE